MKICVLGAGAMGVTSAYMLAKSGHEVTVIDRQEEAARECSYANGGQLSYSHAEPWANPYVFPKLWKWMWQEDAPLVLRFSADPHMIRWGLNFLFNCLPVRARHHMEVHLRLGLYSRKVMLKLMEETGVSFDYQDKGILHVFTDKTDFEHAKKISHEQEALGCHEEILTKDDCLKLDPALAYSNQEILGGIHAPMDGCGDIHLFTKHLAKICSAQHGVTFQYNTRIIKLHKQAETISHVETDQGMLSGFDAYVMALGSYSSERLRDVGIYVPIYPMKGYSITFKANEFSPSLSITDAERKIVYSRLDDRIRVAGTAEFAGYNDTVREKRIEPIIRGVQRLFPKADLSELSKWACLRPSTPDGPPIIGHTPLKNLYINSGQGTLGWTQAAGSAALLADNINNKTPEIPMTGLEISRYFTHL